MISVYLFMYEQKGSEAFGQLEARQESDEMTPGLATMSEHILNLIIFDKSLL